MKTGLCQHLGRHSTSLSLLAHNLTLMEMAHRLHSKSPNAYARYEQGESVPTIDKLNHLMKAIDPHFEPILKVG